MNNTRVIQEIRRQRCCQAQKVFKKSNLTHGKMNDPRTMQTKQRVMKGTALIYIQIEIRLTRDYILG